MESCVSFPNWGGIVLGHETGDGWVDAGIVLQALNLVVVRGGVSGCSGYGKTCIKSIVEPE